jgi:hypothetical protein
VPSAELVFSQLALRHGFAAQKDVAQGHMVAKTTDTCAEPVVGAEKYEETAR